MRPARFAAARFRELVLGALLAAASSCSLVNAGPSAEPPRAPDPPPLRAEVPVTRSTRVPIVLVTIDGARWQEVFVGTDATRIGVPSAPRTAASLMPNLHAMDAAVGAPAHGVIRATGPNFVSLPGYRELLTGRASLACQDNECPRTTTDTILDEASAAGMRVAAFASWERLDRAATARPGAFHVSAGRGGDPKIEPWPGSGDFRPDALTAQLALEHLAHEQPDVLFIGLGEPDEYAHHGDYPGYLRALENADAMLGRLQATLATMGERGSATHVFVTADHGRANDFRGHGGFAPESARVWLFASGPELRARGMIASPAERHLSDVAPTLRVLLALPAPNRGVADGRVLTELLFRGPGTASQARAQL
jgi:Metalloenzyme superfamily